MIIMRKQLFFTRAAKTRLVKQQYLAFFIAIFFIITGFFMLAALPLASASECTDQGKVECSMQQCNIGHPQCNEYPPSKSYDVPEGEECTFTGTIQNSGCAWNNPATLSIQGNGCSREIKYYDCEKKSFSIICSEGMVSFSADDSSYFTLSYDCRPLAPVCGNGVLETGEECEPPATNDNNYCSQSQKECAGRMLGIRDAYGSCSDMCVCSDDDFSYSCVQGECGAECNSDDDCDDDDPSTRDYCSSGCVCSYEYNAFCGNGVIDDGEECESDSDCPEAMICDECECIVPLFCGDGVVDSGEECDEGVWNGVACSPGKEPCYYCTEDCEKASVEPGFCGDGFIDYGEQCDAGAGNGDVCVPECGSTCYYCTEDCMVQWNSGEECYDPYNPPDPYNPYIPVIPVDPIIPELYCPYPPCHPPECGNGIVERGEACDDGRQNGVPCYPPCGADCDYCSKNCEVVRLSGGRCSSGMRPWETGIHGPMCNDLLFLPINAYLDYACGGKHRRVLGLVNKSDNFYAVQDACNGQTVFIEFFFGDVRRAGVLEKASVFVEHKELWADAWLEHSHDGLHWQQLCRLPIRRIDGVDSCDLHGVELSNASFRLRIEPGSGAVSSGFLDFAYLNLSYCYPDGVVCGNGVLEPGEECDDGNLRGGDGCNQLCKSERWFCNDWSECRDGVQRMVCSYAGETTTRVRECSSFNWSIVVLALILLLILLVLFLLPFILTRYEEEKNSRKR